MGNRNDDYIGKQCAYVYYATILYIEMYKYEYIYIYYI